jgi:hypothetical protein
MENVKIAVLLAMANVIQPEPYVVTTEIPVEVVSNVVTEFVFPKMKYAVRLELVGMDKTMAHTVVHKSVVKADVFQKTKNVAQVAMILILTVAQQIKNVVEITVQTVMVIVGTNFEYLSVSNNEKICSALFIFNIVIFLFIGFDSLYLTILAIIVSNTLATATCL